MYASVGNMTTRPWITDLHEERSIMKLTDEDDSPASVEPTTMCEVFQSTVDRIGFRKYIVVGGVGGGALGMV